MPQALGQGSSESVAAGDWFLFSSLRGYRLSSLGADLVAGLALAAIAIPAQMATADLAGLPPQIGFFAFFAGVLGFAAFGDNRTLCCAADSTIAPIFAGSLALLATGKDYPTFAAALALMVGVILMLAGVFRLGRIADFLSTPVLDGFFVGIAAHIIISQLPDILGIPTPLGEMPQRAEEMIDHAHAANPWALIIGLATLALAIVGKRISARIPMALIALIGATLAVIVFGLDQRGVAVLGHVPNALPRLSFPLLAGIEWAQIAPLSLIIANIVVVQTAATTRSFPSHARELPNINRDFIGAGAGNILAGIFGAFPVDASPPSTEIVVASGGRSQLSCLVAACLILLLLVFGTGLLAQVPRAALAGVLFYVALRIVRVREIANIYRRSPPEFLLVATTAAAIIFLPIGEGVAIGMALSLLYGVWSMTNVEAIVFERVPGTSVWWPATPASHGEKVPGVTVLGFQAPLLFLNATPLFRDIRAILQSATDKPKLIVLEGNSISQIDFTAATVMRKIIRECHDSHVDFAIARLESQHAQEAVRRFELDQVLGPNRIFHSVEEAIETLTGKRSGPANRAQRPL